MEIDNKLGYLSEKAGMSQTDLSKKTGISKNRIIDSCCTEMQG